MKMSNQWETEPKRGSQVKLEYSSVKKISDEQKSVRFLHEQMCSNYIWSGQEVEMFGLGKIDREF